MCLKFVCHLHLNFFNYTHFLKTTRWTVTIFISTNCYVLVSFIFWFFSCSWKHSWQYHIVSEWFRTESGIRSHIRRYRSRHLLHSTICQNVSSVYFIKLGEVESDRKLKKVWHICWPFSPLRLTKKQNEMLWSSITREDCRKSSKHWHLYKLIIITWNKVLEKETKITRIWDLRVLSLSFVQNKN